jgi:acetoin utilization deacetylase AcuC-like enzyme
MPPLSTGLAIDNDAFSLHTVRSVPEVPARLRVIHESVVRAQLLDRTLPIHTPAIDNAEDRASILYWIKRHHEAQYIDDLQARCLEAGHRSIMSGRSDAEISRGTFDATWRATGTVLRAVEMVMQNQIRNAFCAIRPPGHHAMPASATGFCFVNHIGVAARYLLEHYEMSRVLILDWDLHHGNGAQASFWNDPRVLFCSIHGDPRELLYPGTGFSTESGTHNNILNIPLPYNTDSEGYQRAIIERFLPRALAFKPEFVLISAGFDTHKKDSFDFMRLETEMFAWLTEQLKIVANDSAQGRLVSILEGGYNLNVLGECVVSHIEALVARD